MKVRYPVAALAVAGGVAVTLATQGHLVSKEPLPPALAAAGLWMPEAIASPSDAEAAVSFLAPQAPAPGMDPATPPMPWPPQFEEQLPVAGPALVTWSRELTPGDTLDGMLREAALEPVERSNVSLALSAEYDLLRLRPGNRVTVMKRPDGAPQKVALDVDRGVRIETVFGDSMATNVVSPKPEIVTLAGETRIEMSIFKALSAAELPSRFAMDLAHMLGSAVDFRRDMSGGAREPAVFPSVQAEGTSRMPM